MKAVNPAQLVNDDRVAGEVLVDAVVVLTVSYLEDYLNCIVGQATFRRPSLVEDYLKTEGNQDEKRLISSGKAPLIALARRRVSWRQKGKPLVKMFDVLFGVPPWPDDDSGRLIRDMVRARQIVVHSGGVPEPAHAKDAETPGLIVQSNKWFYKMNLLPFVVDMLVAAGRLGVYVEEKLASDPRYQS